MTAETSFDRISLIFPCAGNRKGEGFRAFQTVEGETLLRRSLRSFLPYAQLIERVYYLVLDEDEQAFDVAAKLAAEVTEIPVEVVSLPARTRGPAQTFARGTMLRGIGGKAVVCDIDHRLNVDALFLDVAAHPESACHAALWPIEGQELKRWAVACVSDGNIREVVERRLPDSFGSFFGLLGCYYFRDVGSAARLCLDKNFPRFSDYCNALFAEGRPARGVAISEAEFFGDSEQIRRIEQKAREFRGTIFCDIDGTLIVHQDVPDYSKLPQLLPGSREKLQRWVEDGYYVILTTARSKDDEAKIVAAMRALEIPFHHIVAGLPSGPRIVINDRKPYAIFDTQATSLEIMRNQGISTLEIPKGRQPTILRRFDGGSFAETLLVKEGERVFVRKRAGKQGNLSSGYAKLRNQCRKLERFGQLSRELVPAVLFEEDTSHEYFYDMEYLTGFAPISDAGNAVKAAALDSLFDQFNEHVYCHRNRNRAQGEDWLLRHLQSKIYSKIDSLMHLERLRPLLTGEGGEIDGVWHPSLERQLTTLTQPAVIRHFVPDFLSLVHGDLTFQNVMACDGQAAKTIDMEPQDGLEGVELDLGKIFQSTHSQYDKWCHIRTPLCDNRAPDRFTLNFKPAEPDPEILAAVRHRWSQILGCSNDVVDMRGGFYLALHLVRMVPYRLKVSEDHALYALATAVQRFSRSIAQTASLPAHSAAA